MKHAHTPGPWSVIHDSAIVEAGNTVVSVPGDADQADTPEAVANARLIAAAPELLTALEKLVPLVARALSESAFDTMVSGDDYAKRVLTHVEALLAKATGGGK